MLIKQMSLANLTNEIIAENQKKQLVSLSCLEKERRIWLRTMTEMLLKLHFTNPNPER